LIIANIKFNLKPFNRLTLGRHMVWNLPENVNKNTILRLRFS